jgi:hypothetical protein
MGSSIHPFFCYCELPASVILEGDREPLLLDRQSFVLKSRKICHLRKAIVLSLCQ